MGVIFLNGNDYSGGGGSDIVELTQAEYDALPSSKESDDTMYLITDAISANDAEFTHVHGCFLDPNNIVYSAFVFDNTEHSWTAIEDCILTDNLWAPVADVTAAYVRLDGKQVFATYGLEDPYVLVRKGQVVTYRAKSDSTMKAYGVVVGSEVTFLSEYASACYSTQEREVGCWTDGKPIYQKTIHINALPGSTQIGQYIDYPHNISNIDSICNFEGVLHFPNENVLLPIRVGFSTSGFNYQTSVDSYCTSSYIRIIVGADRSTVSADYTIRYTKTTDTAGSGQWTPMAQPTHHYSTNEQVIGTWTNGKPCYEITLEDSGSFVSNTEHIIPIPSNAENVRIMSGFADIGTDWLPISLTLGLGTSSTNGIYCYPNKTNGLHLFSSAWTFTRYSIVIQYTKTTD